VPKPTTLSRVPWKRDKGRKNRTRTKQERRKRRNIKREKRYKSKRGEDRRKRIRKIDAETFSFTSLHTSCLDCVTLETKEIVPRQTTVCY
jgi:hypothetical protein